MGRQATAPANAHATLLKFGFPNSLVRAFGAWVVLVRPAQPTLGSLVLAYTGEERSYGALPPEAFAEQRETIVFIEQALARFCRFERINYLMLMMVDPHVHFHVLPRYSGAREWRGRQFADAGWPGPPDLAAATPLTDEEVAALARDIAAAE
jgi:diadenosine tetraphosphate (Ap4A) HIT family hydrolase